MLFKRTISLLGGLFLAATLNATDPAKQIITRSLGDDFLAYVKPRKMPAVKQSLALKPLEYDLTATTINDSVSLTCTIVTAQPLLTDSMRIDTCSFAFERIFVEPKGKTWVNRIRVYMSKANFQNLFCSDRSPQLNMNGALFLTPQKNWEPQRKTNSFMMQLIDLNTK